MKTICTLLVFTTLNLVSNQLYAQSCPGGTIQIIIAMYDAFGDGWNGGQYIIVDDVGNIVATGTLNVGSIDYHFLCLAPGCYEISVTGGTFPSEIYWELYDPTQTIHIGGGAPTEDLAFAVGGGTCIYCPVGEIHIDFNYNDSDGDGVPAGPFTIIDESGNTAIYYGNIGSSGQDGFCMGEGQYLLSFNPGDDEGGTSWQLTGPYNSISGTSGDYLYFQLDHYGVLHIEGCTDPAACNYNPNATVNNDQCCYVNCGILRMYDDFGDGWNGAQYIIRDYATNVIKATGTMNDGSYQVVEICCAGDCFIFEVTGGSFPAEIHWEIELTGGMVEQGNAPSYAIIGEGCSEEGCTNPQACNYNDLATIDDGSCIFPAPEVCDGVDNDCDGVADEWSDLALADFVWNDFNPVLLDGGVGSSFSGPGVIVQNTTSVANFCTYDTYYNCDFDFDLSLCSNGYEYFYEYFGLAQNIPLNNIDYVDIHLLQTSCDYGVIVSLFFNGEYYFSELDYADCTCNPGVLTLSLPAAALAAQVPGDDELVIAWQGLLDTYFIDLYLSKVVVEVGYHTSQYFFDPLLAGAGTHTISAIGCNGIENFTVTVPVIGCTDSDACNFEPLATLDDGSCTYGYHCFDDDCNTPFADISSTGTLIIPGCDDCTVPGVDIGFDFLYNGTLYNTVEVSNNGTLGLGYGNYGWGNSCLPLGNFDIIMPFWDDLISGQVYKLTQGLPPYREFIVQWTSEHHYPSTTGEITYQVILSEIDHTIRFVYDDVVFNHAAYDYGKSATVGLSFANGDFVQYSCNSISLTNGQCIYFSPNGHVDGGGCTNPGACNFDATAWYDDSSCCTENCLWIAIHDIDPSTYDNAYVSVTTDSGVLIVSLPPGESWVNEMLCLPCGAYTVTSMSNNPLEVTWSWDVPGDLVLPSSLPCCFSLLNGINVGYAGCTDPMAINYNPEAECDDGSCCYNQYELMVTNYEYCNINYTIRAGDCDGEIVEEGVFQFGTNPLEIPYRTICLDTGCYCIELISPCGHYFEWSLDYMPPSIPGIGYVNFGPEAEGEGPVSQAIISVGVAFSNGCTNPSACNYDSAATCDDNSCCDLNCVTIYYTPDGPLFSPNHYYITTEDGELITGIFESPSPISIGPLVARLCLPCGQHSICTDQDGEYQFYGLNYLSDLPVYMSGHLCGYELNLCVEGCMDATACNYNPQADTPAECCYENCVTVDLSFDGIGGFLSGSQPFFVDVMNASGYFEHYEISCVPVDFGTIGYAGQLCSVTFCVPCGSYNLCFGGPGNGSNTVWTVSGFNGGAHTFEGYLCTLTLEMCIEGCMDPAACNYDPQADTPAECCYENCVTVELEITQPILIAAGSEFWVDVFGNGLYERHYIDCWFEDGAIITGIGIPNCSAKFCLPCGSYNLCFGGPGIGNGVSWQVSGFNDGPHTFEGYVCTTNLGMCDGFGDVYGCMYTVANNFDPSASVDDGSCVFANYCPGDLDGSGGVNVTDLLLMMGYFGTQCP